eukprot:TRINITY_DN63290_c0_g1_i1.p1 TRINITY_DN63290_c0_g1~~TRINITY_DN63290_c0_g1_i1.p1  ORF type:complete len:213 (+),score=32.11 TRINITY_DN63290_c0_g1_i1:67-639(+)
MMRVTRLALVQIALVIVLPRASDCADTGEELQAQENETFGAFHPGPHRRHKQAIGCELSLEQVDLVEAYVRGLGDTDAGAVVKLFGPEATFVTASQGETQAASFFNNLLPLLSNGKSEVLSTWCEAGTSNAGVVFSYHYFSLSEDGELVPGGGVFYDVMSFEVDVEAGGQLRFAKVVMFENKFLTQGMLE